MYSFRNLKLLVLTDNQALHQRKFYHVIYHIMQLDFLRKYPLCRYEEEDWHHYFNGSPR